MTPTAPLTRVLIKRSSLAVSLLAAFLLAAPTAQAAPQWLDGSVAKSTVINCPSIIFGNPIAEEGAWSWVGFYADVNDLPHAGEVFYVHVVTGLVGNPCPGGMHSFPEIALPAGVQPAITAGNPVICWKIDQVTNPPTVTRIGGECPQQPSPGSFGGSHGFGVVGQQGGLWPHVVGTVYEQQIPVTSSRQLSGTLASPCDCVRGFVKTIDGNSSPVLESAAGSWSTPRPPAGRPHRAERPARARRPVPQACPARRARLAAARPARRARLAEARQLRARGAGPPSVGSSRRRPIPCADCVVRVSRFGSTWALRDHA